MPTESVLRHHDQNAALFEDRFQLQHRLQELASDDAFLAYLDVEQATNERLNLMLITVARWAFKEGRRDQ